MGDSSKSVVESLVDMLSIAFCLQADSGSEVLHGSAVLFSRHGWCQNLSKKHYTAHMIEGFYRLVSSVKKTLPLSNRLEHFLLLKVARSELGPDAWIEQCAETNRIRCKQRRCSIIAHSLETREHQSRGPKSNEKEPPINTHDKHICIYKFVPATSPQKTSLVPAEWKFGPEKIRKQVWWVQLGCKIGKSTDVFFWLIEMGDWLILG